MRLTDARAAWTQPDFQSFEVVTRSAENAFNSPLKQKRMLVQQQNKQREKAATVSAWLARIASDYR